MKHLFSFSLGCIFIIAISFNNNQQDPPKIKVNPKKQVIRYNVIINSNLNDFRNGISNNLTNGSQLAGGIAVLRMGDKVFYYQAILDYQ